MLSVGTGHGEHLQSGAQLGCIRQRPSSAPLQQPSPSTGLLFALRVLFLVRLCCTFSSVCGLRRERMTPLYSPPYGRWLAQEFEVTYGDALRPRHLSHEEPLLLTLPHLRARGGRAGPRVRRTAQALPAAQGAAALPGAAPVSEPPAHFLSWEAAKNPYLTKTSAHAATNILRLSRMSTQAGRAGRRHQSQSGDTAYLPAAGC